MRDILFGATRAQTAAVRAAARAAAAAFVAEQRALVALWQASAPEHREFVSGEVACLLHVSPATGAERLGVALRLVSFPRLVAGLEDGLLAVPHALALLAEVEHLPAPHASAVLADVLDGPLDADGALAATPSQLRAKARRAAITVDPEAARRRHEQARRTAGARLRPQPDGMADLVLGCTATEGATVLAALRGRAAAMVFDRELTEGQQQVAALLHALGCDRVRVQAVIECPVERAVDLHAAGGSAVWTVDVRMPVAVALGLSDHPALLAGYGPIDADQARALLPQADLVRACVDAETGEVLTAERPVRRATWSGGDPDRARALRSALIAMGTTPGSVPDLRTDGYVPSAALGRLVDLRDVTSVFPGDGTSARRSERDHRLPWPLGKTDEGNLQSLGKHWHRAKHSGWTTWTVDDGTVRWRSPGGGVYDRRAQRTVPPPVPPDATLPSLLPPLPPQRQQSSADSR